MNTPDELPEVSRFVLKVPAHYASQVETIRDSLSASFPATAFSFELSREQNDKVILIPVMEDKFGQAHLCRPPKRSLVSRVYEIINELTLATFTIPA